MPCRTPQGPNAGVRPAATRSSPTHRTAAPSPRAMALEYAEGRRKPPISIPARLSEARCSAAGQFSSLHGRREGLASKCTARVLDPLDQTHVGSERRPVHPTPASAAALDACLSIVGRCALLRPGGSRREERGETPRPRVPVGLLSKRHPGSVHRVPMQAPPRHRQPSGMRWLDL